MAENNFELEGLDELTNKLRGQKPPADEPEGLEGLEELQQRIGGQPEQTPSYSPRVSGERSEPRQSSPIAPPQQFDSPLVQAYAAEQEHWSQINPSEARTVGEFLGKSGQRLAGQLKENVVRVWKGLNMGAMSSYEALDNVAQIVSDVTGGDKFLLFENIVSDMQKDMPAIESSSVPDKLFEAIGRAAIEVPKVATIGKVPGGLPAMGALQAYDAGPEAMVTEALQWGLIGKVFSATAGFPRETKAILYPTLMSGLELSSGGSYEDATVAGITGLVLASVGPAGESVRLGDLLKRRLSKDPEVLAAIERGQKKLDAKNIKKGADDYMSKKLKPSKAVADASDIGRTPVATPKVNVQQKIDEALGDALKLTGHQQQSIPFDQKVRMYMDQFDPKGLLNEAGRQRVLNSLVKSTEATQAKINADIKKVETMDQNFVNRSFDLSEKAFGDMKNSMKAAEIPVMSRLRNWTVKNWIDASGNLKRELLRLGGPAAQSVINRHNAIAGASAKAQQEFDMYKKQVVSNFSNKEVEDLGKIVTLRRIIEIDSYKKHVKHPGGLNGRTAEGALVKLRQNLGEEQFNKVYEASTKHFGWMNYQTQRLFEAGLISKEEFASLSRHLYSPRVYVNKIDPIQSIRFGGKTINVPSSGIEPLQKGSSKALVTNPMDLAAEVASRVTNRIIRNDANRAMLEFAEAFPKNPIVRVPSKVKHDAKGKTEVEPPTGFVRVDALVEGKQRPMFLSSSLADEWVHSNPQMSRSMGNFLRVASGSAIVRPLATGYNPLFVITNFPRDIAHVWTTTGEYNPAAPIYGVQMGRDLLATAGDAFRRKGRWKQYIDEGGGMSFLTHQGLTQFERGVSRPESRASLDPRMAKTKKVFGYLNETSEIWVRLALRERALRNGASPFEATQVARNYLDFAQGGVYSKGIDHVFPYFNAAIQGTRGIAREAKVHPVQTTAKILQLMALEALFELANHSVNPEAMVQIPYEEKLRNWIITMPFPFQDSYGNTRWPYLRIRKDQGSIPFTGISTTLFEKAITDRNPSNKILSIMKESLPIPLEGVQIPIIDAYYGYALNKDRWTGRDIWRGGNVLTEEEIYTFAEGRKPTNPLAIIAGQITGMSPARLEVASGKFIPNNLFTSMMGFGMRKMLEGVTPYDLSLTSEEMMLNLPFVRQAVGYTHPFSHEVDTFNEIAKEARTPLVQMKMQLDEFYALYKTNQLDGGVGTIEAWIKNLPPIQREVLNERLQGRLGVDRAFDRIRSQASEVPSKTWWVSSKQEPPEVRADVFYEEWRRREPESRRVMERVMSNLPGYRTDKFEMRLRQLKNSRGDAVD